MTPVELTALAGVIATVSGVLIAWRKLRPERDALVLTTTQGATTILNDLVKTLYAEIDRLRLREREMEADIRERDERIEGLVQEVEGLRRRAGTRRQDGGE
jgi:hypothetical protein